MKKCPYCGRENADDVTVCETCKAEIPHEEPKEEPSEEPKRRKVRS